MDKKDQFDINGLVRWFITVLPAMGLMTSLSVLVGYHYDLYVLENIIIYILMGGLCLMGTIIGFANSVFPEKIKIETVPVFEYIDMPEDIRERLKVYYEGTDHRAILNDSYTRYPWLCDLGYDDLMDKKLDKWFVSKVPDGTYHVIIHWDW